VTLNRNGRDQNVQVTLAELPDRPQANSDDDSSEQGTNGGTERFGLTLQPLTSDSAQRFGLDADDQGLLVTRVDPSSNAAAAGIRQGDLIQEVNRQPVRTFAEFGNAIRQSGSRPALVLIKRRNAVIYVTLKAGS
jgi:predicted metalloprotease with PDZ domain